MDLNALAERVYFSNIKWWAHENTGLPRERNRGYLLALIVSELCECLEGERKGLMDDKLPHRKMAEVEMADTLIRLLDFAGGFKLTFSPKPCTTLITAAEDKGEAIMNIITSVTSLYIIGSAALSLGEARDDESREEFWIKLIIAKIQAYCTKHGYDLMGAFEEKMAYNAKRADHQVEQQKASQS